MTTNNDPDEIRRDIERTRANLSTDVNALADEAKPGNVVKRQVEGVKESAQNLKERVFGSDDDPYDLYSGPSATERAQDRAQELGADARQAVQQAPRQLKQRTRGNPLAAGLIAFGAGALLGSLIPTSRKEQQLAADLKDKAQPLVDSAQAAAKDAAENLKPQAQEAVQNVKASATESAQIVTEDGKAQAQDVQSHATGAAQDVRGHAGAAAQDVKSTAQSGDTGTGAAYSQSGTTGTPGYTGETHTATGSAYDDDPTTVQPVTEGTENPWARPEDQGPGTGNRSDNWPH